MDAFKRVPNPVIRMDPMQALLMRLGEAGIPLDSTIIEAMMEVDVRGFSDFDPTPFFHDRPLVFLETPSGGVKTISAPHMVATLMTHLELEKGHDVVLIGAKGGYFAALICHLVGSEGSVSVYDPSEEVILHLEERLHDVENCELSEISSLNKAPKSFPESSNRVLVTGSIRELPDWLEDSVSDGGFIIAPLGGEVNQTLIKRERLEDGLHDTALGSVVFGPVDIKESEAGIPSPDTLADVLEEAAAFARVHEAMDAKLLQQMDDLITELRCLPDDLPPPEFNIEFDDDEEKHPLIEILSSAEEWLGGLWPLLAEMFNIRMQNPGAPSDDSSSLGFSGGHEDLIP